MEENQKDDLGEKLRNEEKIKEQQLKLLQLKKELEGKYHSTNINIRNLNSGRIPVSKNFMVPTSYIIEVRNGSESFDLILDEDINIIGRIEKDRKISLEEDYKNKIKEQLDEQGLSEKYDLDETNYIEKEKNDMHVISKDEREKQSDYMYKEEISNGIDKNSDDIISIIKIEDVETFSRILNKNINPEADLYIVRDKNNLYTVVQKNNKGYEEITGLEYNELSEEIVYGLNLDDEILMNGKIEAGELEEIKTDSDRYYDGVVINRANQEDTQLIVHYDKYTGKTDVDMISRTNNNEIVKIDTTAVYPKEIQIGDDIVEVNSKEEEKKEEKEEEKEEEENARYLGDSYLPY